MPLHGNAGREESRCVTCIETAAKGWKRSIQLCTVTERSSSQQVGPQCNCLRVAMKRNRNSERNHSSICPELLSEARGFESGREYALEGTSLSKSGTVTDVHCS